MVEWLLATGADSIHADADAMNQLGLTLQTAMPLVQGVSEERQSVTLCHKTPVACPELPHDPGILGVCFERFKIN
jgi:hypothetical protein